METGTGVPPTAAELRRLAELYRVPLTYLLGAEVRIPDALHRQLDATNVSPDDRATVLEFAGILSPYPSQPSASERLAAVAAKHGAPPAAPPADQPIADKVRYVKSQGQTRNHHCHWPGCTAQVPPAKWGCLAHWKRLPKRLRDRIWTAYSPGQERTLSPSREYLQVADEVQQWIREHGGAP
jgi:transcriptional regulator with XRE-family HTH domain